jgi:hypothetical protein
MVAVAALLISRCSLFGNLSFGDWDLFGISDLVLGILVAANGRAKS